MVSCVTLGKRFQVCVWMAQHLLPVVVMNITGVIHPTCTEQSKSHYVLAFQVLLDLHRFGLLGSVSNLLSANQMIPYFFFF